MPITNRLEKLNRVKELTTHHLAGHVEWAIKEYPGFYGVGEDGWGILLSCGNWHGEAAPWRDDADLEQVANHVAQHVAWRLDSLEEVVARLAHHVTPEARQRVAEQDAREALIPWDDGLDM